MSLPRGRALLQALLAGALLASLSRVPASAAEPDDAAFSLLREQMVTGVSKRPLPLSETPSSVTVIPAAEIRAMGYQTLGDARLGLRLAPGLTTGLEVRNLFDARYGDPGSKEHLQDQIMQDSRTFFVGLTYLVPGPR